MPAVSRRSFLAAFLLGLLPRRAKAEPKPKVLEEQPDYLTADTLPGALCQVCDQVSGRELNCCVWVCPSMQLRGELTFEEDRVDTIGGSKLPRVKCDRLGNPIIRVVQGPITVIYEHAGEPRRVWRS